MPQLGSFTLSDMVQASAALRRLGLYAHSLEDFGSRVVEHLRLSLVDPSTAEPETALVRFYKTHPYGDLLPALQRFADQLLDSVRPSAATKCLTLLATAGDEPAWCDINQSQGHRAVPLPSEEVVGRLPMIAQLIHQFGLAASSVIEPDPDLLVELDEKTFNVFYVPVAEGSQHIPAQDFVARYGIESALGFGGMLPTGDLYAVVLFSKVPIPAETAELFKTLAVSVKVALLPLLRLPLFGGAVGETVDLDDLDARPSVRARTMAIEQLLEVHEQIATEQAGRLEAAWQVEQQRGRQLRELADAALVINASLSLAEILQNVTQRAGAIIGAHRAVTSLSTDIDWGEEVAAVSVDDRDDADDEPSDGPRLAAPLVARDGSDIGLIQLSDKHGGAEFGAEDEAMLVQLAQMASITIENARLYQREHEIAAELQRSLLPQVLPTFEGVEVAARYYSGATGVEVGGDWYDVFPVADGCYGVVLGDVAGRGIAAASAMGQLRMALRAYAMEEESPSAVVGRLDRLVQQLDLVEFATLAYGVWAPAAGGLDLVLAGHPAPIVITPGGEITFVSAEPAVPLGAVHGATFPSTWIDLAAGSTLLLYSDGLVEARDLPLAAGMERLRGFVAGGPSELDPLCQHIAELALSADADDDVTLLAVRAAQG
ncbi:MAG TPA: SpoIIE family protein phosphatase [Acidimicrobiales bacterium]|nr:SpoIIE family protein phosphatase [Acidimicrobiales bacterium]